MAIEKSSFRSPMTAQLLLEEMGREWAHIDVVRDRARRDVVAFSNYWMVADEVHLLNLATHPEARRAGHASRLLAHIIEVGRSRQLPVRHARGAALERGGGAALPAVRLQGGRRPPELLRGRPGRRDRDAAGSDLTCRGTAALTLVALHATAAVVGFGVRWCRFGPSRRPARHRAGARAAPPARGAREPGAGRAGRSRLLAHPLRRDERAGRRDHVRRLRDAQPTSPASIATCSTCVKRERDPDHDLRLGALGRSAPGRDDRAGGDPLVEFGDHSYDHPHMSHLPVARIVEEIDQTEAALARYGKRSVAFRPPFGEWSHRLVYVVQDLRLPTVTWDVVSGDPSARTTTDGMIRNVLGKARAGFDHHLSHQRARLEDGGGAADDPAAGCASAGSASCRCRS